MILLIGSEGNMGQRYQAIFKHLKVEYFGFDTKRDFDIHPYAQRASAFLIATPTPTHCELIEELAQYQKPILCEKPITTNVLELHDLLKFVRDNGVNLQMVNQYLYMPGITKNKSHTYYNYFKHGGDGLHWDCLNVIGLSAGTVSLEEKSPYWDCVINGARLSQADVDWAYIWMMKEWLRNPVPNIDYIEQAHTKVKTPMKFSTVLIAIQARSTSHRLPEKVLADIGGKFVLDHVIDAAKSAANYMNRYTDKTGILVKVSLLIPYGDKIEAVFRKRVHILQGPEDDVLTRFNMALGNAEANYVCRVTGDCPLIHPYVISKHIKYAVMNDYDYVGNGDEELRTAIDGMDCEVISERLLSYLHVTATEPQQREHVTLMARTHRRELKVLGYRYGISMPLLDLSDMKLSIDTTEDLVRVRDRLESGETKYAKAVETYGKQHVHRY